jgi:hypothetical protein
MKKTIFKFGLISGALSAGMMCATVPFVHRLNGSAGYVLGYTTIVLSFLLVFFGIRSYRENVGGGTISFGRGFAIGISITLISCVFYVVTWEIVYFFFMPGFMDHYGDHAIEAMKASGASAAAVQAKVAEMKHLREMYKNPLINAAMTFIEPFPVGLLITLLSAVVLRKKKADGGVEGALPAAS